MLELSKEKVKMHFPISLGIYPGARHNDTTVVNGQWHSSSQQWETWLSFKRLQGVLFVIEECNDREARETGKRYRKGVEEGKREGKNEWKTMILERDCCSD